VGLVFGVLWAGFIIGMIIYSTQIAPKINEKKRQEEIEIRGREIEKKKEEFERNRPSIRREKIIEISREQRRRNLEAGVNKKGIDGELKVRSELDKLNSSYDVFHNITVADADPSLHFITNTEISQIDHLIIGQGGVYVIETKNYSGHIKGSMIYSNWHVTYRSGQVVDMYSPIQQNSKHIQTLKKMIESFCEERKISKPLIPFYNIVVFTGTATLNIEEHKQDFRGMKGTTLKHLGDSKEHPVTILTRNQLFSIVNMINIAPINLTNEMRQLVKHAITENISLTMPDKSEMTKEERLTHLGDGVKEYNRKEKAGHSTILQDDDLPF